MTTYGKYSPRQLRFHVERQATVLDPPDIAKMFGISVAQVEKILDDLDVPLGELPGLDGPRRRHIPSPERNFDRMLSEHGTPVGHARHVKLGQKPCKRCVLAVAS